MILISRGQEPANLKSLRTKKLADFSELNDAPNVDQLTGYQIVKDELKKAQYWKCCYCEQKIGGQYNDLEHFRPKLRANRLPGCLQTNGYWWLAYSWENLLFACASCNRTGKNDLFPLKTGSVTLATNQLPPGNEDPYLLDPGGYKNPVEHIQFVKSRSNSNHRSFNWYAHPRGKSELGEKSIDVCRLNRSDLLDLRNDHYQQTLTHQISAILSAITSKNERLLRNEFMRAKSMISRRSVYSAFSYDAMRDSVPDSELQPILGEGWPSPSDI
jgi:hypothetical protein